MIAGSLLGLDAFVKFLMRCDLLWLEVARLIIVRAASSTLSTETSSPSQTGNIGVCAAKLTYVPVNPSLDDVWEVEGSGIDADSSRAEGISCEASVSIILEAFLEASFMLEGSSCDPISPIPAPGKSQVAARSYYSSMTSSQECLTRSAQFGGTWLLFIRETIVNRSSKTTWDWGDTMSVLGLRISANVPAWAGEYPT